MNTTLLLVHYKVCHCTVWMNINFINWWLDSFKLSFCVSLTCTLLANVLLFQMLLYCSGLTVHSYAHTATSTNTWGLYYNVLMYYMMQEHSGKIFILELMLWYWSYKMLSSDCLSRKHIDHEMMSSCLLKEINTRLKMCAVDTVTSIYFGGGRSVLTCWIRNL